MTESLNPTDAELKESNAITHLFFVLCVALVASFAVWAWYGQLDVVSTAVGEVIPSTQVKSVQHLEGGIVREIRVKEGQLVKKDQALLTLEPTQSGANVDELRVRMASLTADIARLEAEATGEQAPQFPAELIRDRRQLVNQTLAMFKTRKSRIENQLAGQMEIIAQSNEEIEEVTSRINLSTEKLELLKEQIEISNALMKDQLTNRMQHLNLLKEAASLRGNINEDEATLRKARSGFKGAQNKLEAIRESFFEKVREELDEKRRSFEEFSSRVLKFEDSLRRTVLRAPVEGVIKSLYVVTVGGVVAPGGTVLDIVPAGDRLIIEARLAPQDIGYVQAGQTALVTLASADSNRFGNLSGTVVNVSPDTLVSPEGEAFYKVRISTEQAYFERDSLRYNLVPGVQVTASIRTGQRSILAYLSDPFMASVRTAMRER
ncbi:MAG: HlyD family type I secretion periplasmic adaptor subunit [Rhodospirillales bacterium]|nr:HlyD family type I secretion periplasmic adaptor subunit [Rhodospirillales bacterium]